jgi:glycosyltransferase involved in cell wall biosynthesis
MRILIAKSAAWDRESYFKSQHPEYFAIRNLIVQNPQHDFILIGQGRNFEHFRLGKTSIYNLGSGNPIKFLLSWFLRFLLPLFLKPNVLVGMGGIDEIPMAFASIIIRIKFIPVIVIDLWYSLSEMPALVRGLIKSLLRVSLNTSHHILAISKNVEKELIESYKVQNKNVSVYRYKISDMFNPRVPMNMRKVLNSNGPIALTICRINPQKGLEYLIQASQIVVRKIPNVKFVVKANSSEGLYKRHLLELVNECHVEKNFEIIERLSPYEELPMYIAASDVFVLPSISEGLGVVILEAMACGVPVIATKIGGISDVVIDKYNGLLVEPKNAQALADAIISVISDERLKKALSEGALVTSNQEKQNEFQSLLSKAIFQ